MVRSRVLLSAVVAALAVSLAGCDETGVYSSSGFVAPVYAGGYYGAPYYGGGYYGGGYYGGGGGYHGGYGLRGGAYWLPPGFPRGGVPAGRFHGRFPGRGGSLAGRRLGGL